MTTIHIILILAVTIAVVANALTVYYLWIGHKAMAKTSRLSEQTAADWAETWRVLGETERIQRSTNEMRELRLARMKARSTREQST